MKIFALSGMPHFLGNLRLAVFTRLLEDTGVVTLNGLLVAAAGGMALQGHDILH